MDRPQLDRTRQIPDVVVFDLEESHRGYRLNKMCNTLTSERNRRAYQADEETYLARHGLSDEEKRLIRARDWAGLNAIGGNIYFLIKLAFVVGQGLYRIGAQMRGETFEAFLASRKAKGAR